MTWDWQLHKPSPQVADHGPHTPRRIVLHSTESDGDGPGYGDSIVAFWRRQGLGYGAHFVVSRDGVVSSCLNRTRVAWHVASRNTGSIGIEQSGFARFSAAQWAARETELNATARVIAHLCAFWGIPVVESTESGVSTHAEQSRKYGGSHTDPGAHYPFSHVLGMARSYVHAEGWSVPWDARTANRA